MNCGMKNKRSSLTSQIKSQKSPRKFRRSDYFSLSLPTDGLHFYVKNKKKSVRSVLLILIKYGNQFQESFMTEDTIVDEISFILGRTYCRQTISEAVCELEADGVLKIKRKVKDSNHYLLADDFMWRQNLEALVPLFPTTELLNFIIQKYKPWTLALLFSISATVPSLAQNPTQRDYKELLIEYHESLLPKKGVRDLAEQDWSVPPVCEIPKRRSMKAIPSYIHEIKSINLTDAGRISLSPFSKKVIGMADKKTAAKKPTGNPFLYFVKVCNLVSRDLGEQPNWPIVTQLSIQMNVSPDSPKLENNEVNSINGTDETKRPAAWQPTSTDPYYRTPSEIDRVRRYKANRELEWSRMAEEDPSKLERIQAYAKKMRQDIGLNEQGEKVAEPVTTFFGIVPQEKESRGPAGPTAWQPVAEADTPYVNEDGVWEEI